MLRVFSATTFSEILIRQESECAMSTLPQLRVDDEVGQSQLAHQWDDESLQEVSPQHSDC